MNFNYSKEREAKKMFKKAWALLLVVAMLLSCVGSMTALAASFDAFELVYTYHGSNENFRFVVKKENLPSDPNVIVGAPVKGTLEYDGGSLPFESKVTAVEDRGDGSFTVTIPPTETVGIKEWGADTDNFKKHKFKLVVGEGDVKAPTTTPSTGETTTTTPSQSTANVAFTDIADSPYIDEIGLLNAISVLAGDPAGTFRPKDGISRAEMAAIIVRIYGLESSVEAQKGNTLFDDVPASHWASGYINIASGLGVINGDGDGKFRPDDKVSYNEAVKMLVCVLGYDLKAKESGGWPAGYLVCANDLKVSEDVIEKSGEASRETVAKLVYNAIDVDYQEKTGYGENEKYVSVDGRTLMTEKLKITKVEDTVTETNKTSFAGQGDLKDTEVRIGDTKYLISADSKIYDYIGYPVTAYVKYDSKVDKELSTLVYFTIDYKKLAAITVEPDDIAAATSNYIDVYDDKDNSSSKTRYTVESKAFFFVNGIGDVGFDVASLAPLANGKASFDGKLVILDKDKDDTIDTLFVEKNETVVVNKVTKSNGGFYITGKNKTAAGADIRIPAKGKFDLDDKDVIIDITKDGKKIAYTDIKEFDVISYANAGNVYTLKVSSTKAEGTVDRVTSDDEVIIGDRTYEYSAHILFDTKCDAGDKVTLYLDGNGKIAYIEKSTTGADNYVYLMNLGSDTIMDNTTFKMSVIDSNNTVVKPKFADKVNFIYDGVENAHNNGDPYTSKDLTNADFAAYGLMDATGAVIPQLIKISKNSDDEVRSIEVAKDIVQEAADHASDYKGVMTPKKYTNTYLNTFRSTSVMAKDGKSALGTIYAYSGGCFSSGSDTAENVYFWKGKTLLFVPMDNGQVVEDDVAFGSADTFLAGDNYNSYTGADFKLYDVDKSGNPAVIVATFDVNGKSVTRSRSSNYMVVTRVASAKVDGETKYKITGIAGDNAHAGDTKSITLSATTAHDAPNGVVNKAADEIKVGDIINYYEMPNGKVYKFRVLFNSNNLTPYYAAINGGSEYVGNSGASLAGGNFGVQIANVALGFIKEYTLDGGNESIIFTVPAGYPAGNVASAPEISTDEISLTDFQSFFIYDVKTGGLKEADATDIPQPEKLEDSEVDENNLPANVLLGNDGYYKCPRVLIRVANKGDNLQSLNLIYFDEGLFD